MNWISTFAGMTDYLESAGKFSFVIARGPRGDVAISRNQVVTGDCFVTTLLAMTHKWHSPTGSK